MPKENLFKRILQIIFCIALISPLVMDRHLFYPYVTSAALFFRLFVAALFFAWLLFILLYPQNRPKKQLLFILAGVYLLAMVVATVFSANPYLSFWGDAERMFGFLGLLHFFILFFVGTTIFSEKKEIIFLLNFFVAVTLAAAFYGILQRFGFTSIKPGENRIVATVGNAGVLAGYLIFGLFFSLFLALKSNKSSLTPPKGGEQKPPPFREGRGGFHPFGFIYLAVSVVMLIAIVMTGTRGAYLGVLAGAVFLFIIFLKNLVSPASRKKLIIVLILFAAVYGLLLLNADNPLVRNNSHLYRVTHISLEDATIQQRFMSWSWGLKGFLEHPILGYGYENYAVPFNKYFESKYYNYATEEYFDRAHNIIVELLATTGLIGLLSYLALLAGICFLIWKAFKKNKDHVFLGVFGGLAVAYFIQNLFFFDMLPAMLGFMVFLIFINNFSLEKISLEQKDVFRKMRLWVLALPVLMILAAFLYVVSNFIVKPYQALRSDAEGQVYLYENYDTGINKLRRSVSYGTFLDLDIRSSVANAIYNYYLGGATSKNKKDDLTLAVELYKKNINMLPNDTYYNYKIGEIMNYASVNDQDEKIRDQARQYIEKSISTSPNRATIYFILSENYLLAKKYDDAVAVAQKTVALNDEFGDAWWQLAKAYFVKQDFPKVREALIKTIELGHHVSEGSLTNFMSVFDMNKNINDRIQFFELVVKNGTNNYIYDSTLAQLYSEIGNKQEAIAHAKRSAELNPDVKDKVDKFIKKVEENL